MFLTIFSKFVGDISIRNFMSCIISTGLQSFLRTCIRQVIISAMSSHRYEVTHIDESPDTYTSFVVNDLNLIKCEICATIT